MVAICLEAGKLSSYTIGVGKFFDHAFYFSWTARNHFTPSNGLGMGKCARRMARSVARQKLVNAMVRTPFDDHLGTWSKFELWRLSKPGASCVARLNPIFTGNCFNRETFCFCICGVDFAFLVAAVALIIPGKAKVPTIIVGAMLTVLGPVALQNLQVQWQMKRYAKTSELRIIERSSLFKSIRERSDGYQSPHGVACSSENWPFLWSYRHRDWIALPSNTRYGGDTKERVMSVCLSR